MNSSSAFAEVIESSLQTFTGQCWQWNIITPFGSLVTIKEKERTLFGIVSQIQTGSMDPMRYPFPYQKTHEELLAEQPQIFEFLKTTFSCFLVGYSVRMKVFYLIPSQPASIHSFITPATPEEKKLFFSSNHYLHLLFQAGSSLICLDELLLALLKQQNEIAPLKEDRLQDFINTFSLLAGNDYRRLKLFLQRAEAILS